MFISIRRPMCNSERGNLMTQRHAFTWVELLVALAIVAIAIALLIPAT